MDKRRMIKVYLSPAEVDHLKENLRRWGFQNPDSEICCAIQCAARNLAESNSRWPLVKVPEQ